MGLTLDRKLPFAENVNDKINKSVIKGVGLVKEPSKHSS